MRNIMIGAAAIALAATGAYAEPGNGKGNGNGSGKPAQGPSMQMDRGDRGPSMKDTRAERGPAMKAERGPSMQADRGPSMKVERRVERAVERDVERAEVRRADRVIERRDDRRDNRREDRRLNDANDRRDVRDVRYIGFDDDRSGGLLDGCPPGLAKKNNGCTPPGLAKDRNYDYRSAYYNPSYYGYRSLGDGRYYYDDGYLYRMNDRGSVLGYIPLLGGALSVGNQWPSNYQPVSVPNYYVDYYNLGPADAYRYSDNVLYRVDPQTSTIDSIAALLTGDKWAVGQPMPVGYDVYNVPYAYRDRYVDGPDASYRYSDGYVYQVDPTTQLVQAVIELLV